MTYTDIIESLCSAKSTEELSLRVNMWDTAIDKDLCRYTETQAIVLDNTLRNVAKALFENHPATFYMEGQPIYH